MKINKNIPLEKYTDNVRRIIRTPADIGYTSMLCSMPDEDIKTAMKLMAKYETCKNKQQLCSTELQLRGMSTSFFTVEWKNWFSREWTKWTGILRKACGYEY